jgi:hypothetical protein
VRRSLYLGAYHVRKAAAIARLETAEPVVAADARFSDVVAERTEVLAEVPSYWPGEFYLRELPVNVRDPPAA